MAGEETASRRRALVLLGRAWKRVMLDKDGKLHPDAKLILRDLFDKSGFYAPVQNFPGQHDLTVARSARRELVIHILALIQKPDDVIMGTRKQSAIPEHKDDDVEGTVNIMEEVYDN